MAEQNKSQLISEAELIEAINADSIISVSLGAGQPQKNVKLSTLASVVAGLMFSFRKVEGPEDLNTMKTGFCEMTSNMINIPPVNDSGYIGYILSFAEKENYRIQIAMCYVENSLWFRRTVQGESNYTAWEKFK